MLALVTEGVADMTKLAKDARANGCDVEPAELERVWRERVPEPIAPRDDR